MARYGEIRQALQGSRPPGIGAHGALARLPAEGVHFAGLASSPTRFVCSPLSTRNDAPGTFSGASLRINVVLEGVRVRRRDFIEWLGGTAVWPSVVLGQQPNQVRRVGVLMEGFGTEPVYQSLLAAFVQGLRQLGWIEGQNLRIDVRWSASNTDLARTYAVELVDLRPDVLLATTTLNLTMIRQAANILPVVFVAVADPSIPMRFRQPVDNRFEIEPRCTHLERGRRYPRRFRRRVF